MDKGFSEDELADIMNEIESLEKEFSEPEAVEMKAEHHEILEKLTKMPVEEVTGVSQIVHHENVHEITQKHTTPHHEEAHSSMSFKVSGQMKLELGFDISGTQVSIHVNEHEGLVVELEGGAKFHIPLNQASSYKKVS